MSSSVLRAESHDLHLHQSKLVTNFLISESAKLLPTQLSKACTFTPPAHSLRSFSKRHLDRASEQSNSFAQTLSQQVRSSRVPILCATQRSSNQIYWIMRLKHTTSKLELHTDPKIFARFNWLCSGRSWDLGSEPSESQNNNSPLNFGWQKQMFSVLNVGLLKIGVFPPPLQVWTPVFHSGSAGAVLLRTHQNCQTDL